MEWIADLIKNFEIRDGVDAAVLITAALTPEPSGRLGDTRRRGH